MGSRMDLDFSRHVYSAVRLDGGVVIYELEVPGTRIDQFSFINARGILAVTGDYGNWIFSREFHPAAKDSANDHYWLEKLKISSDQTGEEYDPYETQQLIQERLEELEESGWTGDRLAEMREYLKECLDYVDSSEHEYTSFAYNNYPSFLAPESVPYCRRTVPQLLFVLDAFDEMCAREEQRAQDDKAKDVAVPAS